MTVREQGGPDLLDEFAAVIAALQPLADAAGAEDHHWIHGDDEGLSWCRKCAEKRIAELRAEKPSKDICLDGGYDWPTSDGCAHCEDCGALLVYVLTDYGAQSELAHFEENGIGEAPLDPETAFHIQAMVNAFEYSRDHDARMRALEIGQQAAALANPKSPGASNA